MMDEFEMECRIAELEEENEQLMDIIRLLVEVIFEEQGLQPFSQFRCLTSKTNT